MFTPVRRLIARAAAWLAHSLATPTHEPVKRPGLAVSTAAVAAAHGEPVAAPYTYPLKLPAIAAAVTPAGVTAPVAMDSNATASYAQLAAGGGQFAGFPGYAYLAGLATRPEFRLMSGALATEMTREWVAFHGSDSDGDETGERIKEIEAEFEALGVRDVMQKAVEVDAQAGCAHIYLNVESGGDAEPLIIDPRTVTVGSFKGIRLIEPIWATPAQYNSTDPTAPNFYRPSSWYIMGREYHSHRLMTYVSRPVPDIFKPAFNFGGMSLYQLVEETIDNWRRTRASVTDMVHTFSITAMKTDMSGVLDGTDNGAILTARAQLFKAHKNNRGLMLIDKEREELQQLNTPLSGLHELQAQAQEQMCMYARMPAVVLTGLSPSGLNTSSDGEIRAFYDWIAAQQEAYLRKPIQTILELVQLSKWGDIDRRIGFNFVPLYQMTPEQLATIQKTRADTDGALIDRGIIDPSEARERLAGDKDSGYHGLDVDAVAVPPAVDPEREPEAVE